MQWKARSAPAAGCLEEAWTNPAPQGQRLSLFCPPVLLGADTVVPICPDQTHTTFWGHTMSPAFPQPGHGVTETEKLHCKVQTNSLFELHSQVQYATIAGFMDTAEERTIAI